MDTPNFLALVVGFMIANFLLLIIKKSDDDHSGGGDGGMMTPLMVPTSQINKNISSPLGISVTKQKIPIFLLMENFIGIYDSANVRTSTDDAMYPVDTAMKKMIIVPGLRSMPKRYFVKGMQTNYVGAQAENLAELLANPKIKKTVRY